MKTRITLVLGVLILILSSCSKDDEIKNAQPDIENQQVYSVDEINHFISEQLRSKGNLDWLKDASAQMLFSAVTHGQHIISIGYGKEGQFLDSSIDKSDEDKNAINQIQKLISLTEGIQKSEQTFFEDDTLQVFEVEIENYETIVALMDSDLVRYLDPIAYDGYNRVMNQDSLEKSAGCVQSGEQINRSDYRIVSPSAWVPWNYDIHNIPAAWDQTTGVGVTVGLIDTGLSKNRSLLGNDFNNGFSNNRFVEKFGTYIDSPWWWANQTDGVNDKCGHGTMMSTVIASPRNNDSMPMGVAYNCNLVSYRATSDVILDDYHERKGVSEALKQLADRSDVKIISMSIGFPWSIGNVRDAVKYAYSKGKLIIAAGGTSTTFTNWYGVIFPASMKETIAVTGIKDNGYRECDICHKGDRIDFTIVMQRAASSNRTVPALGFNQGDRVYVGGSSIATATTAGIAALVWSKYPNLNRDQVIDKLKKASEFYPNKNKDFGYGNIDALKAVR